MPTLILTEFIQSSLLWIIPKCIHPLISITWPKPIYIPWCSHYSNTRLGKSIQRHSPFYLHRSVCGHSCSLSPSIESSLSSSATCNPLSQSLPKLPPGGVSPDRLQTARQKRQRKRQPAIVSSRHAAAVPTSTYACWMRVVWQQQQQQFPVFVQQFTFECSFYGSPCPEINQWNAPPDTPFKSITDRNTR